jgi:MFS family permease
MAHAELVGKAAAPVDERQLMRRVTLRLMPLVTLIYLIAIIDRSNVGFAKLQMVQDLHMSEAVYGLGASLFFIGYLVFEIPSTLAVHRFGARGWLARIMLTWGIVTILLAFAYSTTSFYVLRLLLGVAEAGAYPGLIYFITLWFPPTYRVGVVGVLTLGSAFGNMLGALVGGPLLDLNGVLGFAGWQWVFLATGVPAVIMTFAILLFLPSRPSDARFLSDEEKTWLNAALRRGQDEARPHGSIVSVIWDSRVLFFSLMYALILCALYGVIYWLPTVVKGFGVTGTQNGLISSVPWAVAAIALMIIPRRLEHEPACSRPWESWR